jgi:hypothetical protein
LSCSGFFFSFASAFRQDACHGGSLLSVLFILIHVRGVLAGQLGPLGLVATASLLLSIAGLLAKVEVNSFAFCPLIGLLQQGFRPFLEWYLPEGLLFHVPGQLSARRGLSEGLGSVRLEPEPGEDVPALLDRTLLLLQHDRTLLFGYSAGDAETLVFQRQLGGCRGCGRVLPDGSELTTLPELPEELVSCGAAGGDSAGAENHSPVRAWPQLRVCSRVQPRQEVEVRGHGWGDVGEDPRRVVDLAVKRPEEPVILRGKLCKLCRGQLLDQVGIERASCPFQDGGECPALEVQVVGDLFSRQTW